MSGYCIMEQYRHALSSLVLNLGTKAVPQVLQSGHEATCIGKKQ